MATPWSCARRSEWRRGLAVTLLALLLAPRIAAAEPASLVEFFRWSPRVPNDVNAAVDLYEKGDLLGAAEIAERVLDDPRRTAFRDDLLSPRSASG